MKAYRKSYHLSKGYPGYPVTMPSLYRIKKNILYFIENNKKCFLYRKAVVTLVTGAGKSLDVSIYAVFKRYQTLVTGAF